MGIAGFAELVLAAGQLLDAHALHKEPLLLANAWDVASARNVEMAGFDFIATSSRAIAAVLGEADDDTSDPDVIFDWIERIARAVVVPVTVDLQAGLRLGATELIERTLAAGAVGCNIEDSDHRHKGQLLDRQRQAEHLHEVRQAADSLGVHVVINARIDTFLTDYSDATSALDETVDRGQLYLQAGADCVYPFAVVSMAHVQSLVDRFPGAVNITARRGGLRISELRGAGVRRISLASGIQKLMNERHLNALKVLADGGDLEDL